MSDSAKKDARRHAAPPISGEVREQIEKLLADARRQLVDTGARNRLIHVNRNNARANALNVIEEHSVDLFRILRTEGHKMRFLARGHDEESEDGDPINLASAVNDVRTRYRTGKYIQTSLSADALAKRLLRLARAARTAEEEQGISVLYLALGFLTWYEQTNSNVPRESPLILLPVELVRHDKHATYELRCREDDIVTNMPLQMRLMRDFDIHLPDIDDGDEFKPQSYLRAVAELAQSKQGWKVEEDAIQLGFFSFAKQLMQNDLKPKNWPDDALVQHPLIAGLVHTGFERQEPRFADDDKLDPLLEPAEIIQVMDADASQTKVIEEVRAGANMVVQGPPGTGKSQTIANIIAAAVHDGKTVLFMAEKMAALSVVQKRLESVNLGDICVELHSRKANKRDFSQSLGKTLDADIPAEETASPDELRDVRNQLNQISSVLHAPMGALGYSPYDALAQLVGFADSGASPPPRFTEMKESLAGLTCEKGDAAAKAIGNYVDVVRKYGRRVNSPFYGASALHLQRIDMQLLERDLEAAPQAIADLQKTMRQLQLPESLTCSLADVPGFVGLIKLIEESPQGWQRVRSEAECVSRNADLRKHLQVAADWHAYRAEQAKILTDDSWSRPAEDVERLRNVFKRAEASFWMRWFSFSHYDANKQLAALLKVPLPNTPTKRLRLVDALMKGQKMRGRYEEIKPYVERMLGTLWCDLHDDFPLLMQTADWLAKIGLRLGSLDARDTRRVISAAAEGGMDVSLSEAAGRVRQLAGNIFRNLQFVVSDVSPGADSVDNMPLKKMHQVLTGMCSASQTRYEEWVALQIAAQAMKEQHCSDFLERIDADELSLNDAKREFLYALAGARWSRAIDVIPALREIRKTDRHQLASRFKELDLQRLDDTQTLILKKHLAQMPRSVLGEMRIVLGEIGRQRGHMQVRKLINKTAGTIQRIKPVFLMSPISVAQYLPPGIMQFDLLVIDEASQVRPADALGGIARARQIVVVGDEKQLPPTSFFDRLTGEGDDDDGDDDESEWDDIAAPVAEMESVLSLCKARGLPSRMLEWHYRSRDPSLIRVSNKEFYDNKLVLPPSPLEGDSNYGLSFVQVPGAYGGSGRQARTNRIEAEHVADAVAKHARENPDRSLGVVTFSAAQYDMVAEMLEFKRRSDKVLDEFLREGKAEDAFIKNIENVQGDERDVIYISVGYGPSEPGGGMHMNFGPVNRDGGERRLNVLFTRARMQCKVFASFHPEQIAHHQNRGVQVLRQFLEFAKTGQIIGHHPTGAGPESPFEEEVAKEILAHGFKADYQVGSEGFRIDLGVRDPARPGKYILAVECDGARYHSALWARERDRHRQSILEGIGWNFHRIWSTDWFYQRAEQVGELKAALDKASKNSQQGVKRMGVNVAGNLHREEDVKASDGVFSDADVLSPSK